MSGPRVSVIIPTAGRPHWLPRAVASSLAGLGDGEVEVIVVPNGPDESWRESLLQWQGHAGVRILPISEPNQNIARNHGLAEARGEYVRFLDDDDYLIPEAACSQYRLMHEHDLDVCSGPAEARDVDGALLTSLGLPDTNDFLLASIGSGRLQLPLVHVYRRSTLAANPWPVELLQSEDIAFVIRYACLGPRSWAKISRPVGVWFQHDGPRMSFDRPMSSAHESTARELLRARELLDQSQRLTPEVDQVIAGALWQVIHRSFFLRPFYWSRVAGAAAAIDPGARPDTPLFRNPAVRWADPVLLHWLALPLLFATYTWRRVRSMFQGRDYRRTL